MTPDTLDAGLVRPPWRKVTSVVRFRRGWAVFLECPGHIMFIDTLLNGAARIALADAAREIAHGATAPPDMSPKRMRCWTCAGAAGGTATQRQIDAVLRGETLKNKIATGYVDQALEHRERAFLHRVRRYGVEDAMAAVAEVCARKGRAP